MRTESLIQQLAGPRIFECLCRELLAAEGAKNVRGASTGNDQGADLFADIPLTSPIHDELVPFLVQCKWYSAENSVGAGVLNEGISSLELHRARGLLIITSSTFSGTLISKANAITKEISNNKTVVLWDGNELGHRLSRYPRLLSDYLQDSGGDGGGEEAARQDSRSELELDHYLQRAAPARYQYCSVASFPEEHLVDAKKRELEELETEFSSQPPLIVVIDGGVYTGKTGLAWSLLNSAKTSGYSCVSILESVFLRAYFRDKFHRTALVPRLLAEMRSVDILLVEELGSRLKGRSSVQEEAARILKDLLQERVALGKTVVVERSERGSRELWDYTEYLASSGIHISMGNKKIVHGPAGDTEIESKPKNSSVPSEDWPCYLGKTWLLEKYEKLQHLLEGVRRTLLTPEEEHMSGENLLHELSGQRVRSKIQCATDELEVVASLIENYVDFIESLPFEAIEFKNGETRLIVSPR